MHLRLSDVTQVESADGAVHPLSAIDAALLAWLAVEGPTPRKTLGRILWPRGTEAQAATALRQRLFQLKKSLGTEPAVGSPVLRLAEIVTHDLAEAGELLGGLALPDAPEFDAWLRRHREQRSGREVDALRAQAQALEDAGEIAAALPVAQALLALEPVSEVAHRRVMQLHYLRGDRAAALAAFDRCEQALKHELGARPSAQTLELLAAIERSGGLPRTTRGALPATVLRPPRVVGRDAERQALRRAWQGAKVAALIGEAGMGKSRLLGDFVDSEPNVARAAGRPGDAGVPFATLSRLLRAVSERTSFHALDPAVREQLALLMPELGDERPRFAETQPLRLRRALADCLRVAQTPDGMPLDGLALDDLHFADAASLEMLGALIEQTEGGSLRWAIAFRPVEAGGALLALKAALTDAARIEAIAVGPLNEAALAELVDQLGLGLSGARIAARLHRATGGNPLYVLETLKQAWVEQTLDQLESHAAPPRPVSVERLIDQRIARLSPQAMALARVASIAAVDFELGLAEAVLRTSAIHFADALNELEAAQVLHGTQFVHDLVFDAVLRSVPQAVARHTHAAVAQWLADRGGEAARVAQHWLDAGQPREAIAWFGRAALKSERGLRLREAIDFLELKARLETEVGAAADAFDSAMQAARISAGVDHERDSGDERCDRLDRLAVDAAQAVRARLWRARLAELRDDPDAAEPTVRAALHKSLELDDAGLVAQCRLRLATNLAIQDRLEEASEQAFACHDWFEAHGSDDDRGDLQGVLAGMHESRGRLAEARAHHAAAAACFERAGRHAKLADTYQNLAANHLHQGDLVRARECLHGALRGYGQLDDQAAARGPALAALGACNSSLGRYREALDCLAQARALMEVHQPGGVAFMSLYDASCWRHLGQWSRVHQCLAQLAEVANPPPSLLAGVLLQRHHLAKAQGRPAPELLAQALEVTPPGAQLTLRMLIEVEQALDLPAPDGLRQLDAVATQAATLGHSGVVLATHVRAAEIAGAVDPALARRHAETALALLDSHAYIGPYGAEPWLAAARALAAGGDEGAAAAVLRQGREWILTTARDHVPDEFRDSFLNRNPVNQALLALSARHEVADGQGIDKLGPNGCPR